MCLVARAGPCDAENPATQEDDHAALCWKALRTTATRHPASTYRKAKPVRQILEMPSRYCFHSTRPAPWDAGRVASTWSRAGSEAPEPSPPACVLVVIEDN